MDALKKATITPVTDANGTNVAAGQREPVTVHFNPETLEITLTNNLKQGRGRRPAQTVTDTTAKLSVELIFDTTTTGADVRGTTDKIARLMDPAVETGRRQRKVPAIVLFEWGTVSFSGYIDSYSEKLDFFSVDGVPLRATVSLSLTQQERNFHPSDEGGDDEAGQAASGPDFGAGTPTAPAQGGGSIENSLGGVDPSTGAAIGEANGIENLRFPEVDQIALPDLSELGNPPAAFASGAVGAGAGVGLGAGAGFGASAGVGLGAGAGLGASAGAGAGIGLDASAGIGLDAGAGFSASAGASAGFDASASAASSFSATADAFSGLQTSTSRSVGSVRAGAAKLASFSDGLAAGGSAGVALGAGAGVQLGGQSVASVGVGLSAGAGFGASASAVAGANVTAHVSFLED